MKTESGFLLVGLLILASPLHGKRELAGGMAERARRHEGRRDFLKAARYYRLAGVFYGTITAPMYEYDIEYCRRTGNRSFMKGLLREFRILGKRVEGVDRDAARCIKKAGLDKTGLRELEDRVRDFMTRTFERTMEKRNRQFGLHAPDLERRSEWAKASDAHVALAWFKRDVAAAYCHAEANKLAKAGRKQEAERLGAKATKLRNGADAHDKKAKKLREKARR